MNPNFLTVPTGVFLVPPTTSSELLLQFSLILPTYQERDNIPKIVQILTDLLDPVLPGAYELIVVDDDSPDGTWQVAAQLMPAYPQLQVMRRQTEKGLSTAVIRGWQAARGNILGVIDADLQHPPQVLLDLWQEIVRGADLAVGSRHIEGGGVSEWSLARRCLSRGAQILGLLILPEVLGRLSDPMSGYFIVRRGAIAQQIMSPVGYKILVEVAARGRIRWIREVGYVFQERARGESKVTWKQYVEYLQHLIQLRCSLSPMQRLMPLGILGLSGVVINMAAFYGS
ncbi:MAG: polyprenol monophosphomannose synthase [Spirulina sp. DLM2.Bin59]|nr:MAG: polyprenol monophosphomannose synthase [Spirulina sp. DLM2.Bin59]